MQKILSLLAFLFLVYTQAHAQKLFFGFGHVVYAQPSGKALSAQYAGGVGGEIGAGVKIINKTYATGTLGYTYFFDKANLAQQPGDLHYVPVRLGIRQGLLPMNILFAHADFGTASVKNKLTDGTRFTGSVGVGAKLTTFDLSLDYEFFGRKKTDPAGANSWIGFKAGFRLGL